MGLRSTRGNLIARSQASARGAHPAHDVAPRRDPAAIDCFLDARSWHDLWPVRVRQRAGAAAVSLRRRLSKRATRTVTAPPRQAPARHRTQATPIVLRKSCSTRASAFAPRRRAECATPGSLLSPKSPLGGRRRAILVRLPDVQTRHNRDSQPSAALLYGRNAALASHRGHPGTARMAGKARPGALSVV